MQGGFNMIFERDTSSFKNEQYKRIEKLIDEGLNSITTRDVLNGRGRCIDCHEAEIDYFININNFFDNSISHRIMHNNQDVIEEEFMVKKKI